MDTEIMQQQNLGRPGIGWKRFFLLETVSILFLYSCLGISGVFPGISKGLGWDAAYKFIVSIQSPELFAIQCLLILFVFISPFWLRRIEKKLSEGLPIIKWLLVYNILLIPIIYVGGNLLAILGIMIVGGHGTGAILGATIYYGAFFVPISVILFSILPALIYLFFYRKEKALKITTLILAIGLGLGWGGLFLNVTTCGFNADGRCVYRRAEKAHNVEICNKLPRDDTEDGASYCRDKYQTKEYKGPSYTDWQICNQLSTDWKYQCLYNMAIKLNNASPCDKMASDYYLTSSCYSELARKTKNPALCEKLQSGSMDYSNRDSCYSVLAQVMNNPLLCDNVSTDRHDTGTQGDATQRDVCFLILATQMRDSSLCNNVSLTPYSQYNPITIRDSCFGSFKER